MDRNTRSDPRSIAERESIRRAMHEQEEAKLEALIRKLESGEISVREWGGGVNAYIVTLYDRISLLETSLDQRTTSAKYWRLIALSILFLCVLLAYLLVSQ